MQLAHWLLAITFITVSGADLSGQGTFRGKLVPPDVYEFAPPLEFVPRYRHDPKNRKLILNPDFFCTRCVKEKRILMKSRDEMKSALEVTKRYPLPLEGKDEEHFGEFRLMEHDANQVLDFLHNQKNRKFKLKNPVFIEDEHFRVFTDLESFHTKKPVYPRREIELRQLADIFPKITEKTIVLKPHHRAHLYLIRARRVKRDFAGLVGYDPKKPYMTYRPPYMGMRQKWEIFIFNRHKDCDTFMRTYLGQNAKADGLCWHTLKDRSMVAILHAEGLRDVDLNNTFAHRFSYNLITGFQGYRYNLPTWLALGYAHVMERRERTDFNTFIFGEGKIPSFLNKAKWKPAIRKLIVQKKLRPFQQYADVTEVGGITPLEHLVIWSQVSYLMQQDQKKMGRFIEEFKTRKKGESMRNLVIRCFRTAWGTTMTRFFEGWKKWVLATYPSV